MASIEVDGVTYEVRDGTNLLHACLSHGLDLPYFCWHPCLGSVGACRQCAVVQYRDADDTRGRLTMACMTPASDGVRLSIRDEQAVQFRESVIEWLMLNHPHDCPVCEEGGECHLQDMTVMTGHTFRRYRGSKRTFRNQYLGPFVTHEMNRCITCYRCVRYYRDYAGGGDLEAFGSRDRIFFGRAEDGVLQSEFAGNLVEVCPTGVFADKTFSASYTRKWDLTSAPSICHGCALGCNTVPGERYGRLKRVHNRYHGDVNGYFLCDRGRFGTGFVNDAGRLRHGGERREDGSFDPLTPDDALRLASELLGNGRVAGIGSPRASLESNFTLQRLVGAERFSPGFADHEAAMMDAVIAARDHTGVRVPTLREVEQADAVLVLGEDVSNSAPRLALALRQTVRNLSIERAAEVGVPAWQDAGVRSHAGTELTPLLQATVLPTRLADVAPDSVCGEPARLAAIGEALAGMLSGEGAGEGLDDERRNFVARAAEALRGAARPLIVSGTGSGSAAVIRAAAAIAQALAGADRDPALLLNVPECNSLGAALLGGRRLGDLLAELERGDLDAVIVLENELQRRADPELLRRALARARVVVLDCLEGATPETANLVLPAATFAESDGTWVSSEGRAQRFYKVFAPAGDVAASWQWLQRLADFLGGEAAASLAGFDHVDGVLRRLAQARPELAEVADAGPGADARLTAGTRVPRQPHRYSGRTAMNANVTMHEPQPPRDEESPLGFSMEGYRPPAPGALLSYSWSPGWNSNQSIFKFQAEVGGHLRGGPAGVRLPLAEIASGTNGTSADAASPSPGALGAGLTAVPLQEVFGSEELSGRAEPIRQRGPAPYVVLAPADAELLGVKPGAGIRLSAGAQSDSFMARVEPAMAAGHVGLVQGMTGTLWAPPGTTVEAVGDPDYAPPTDPLVIARG